MTTRLQKNVKQYFKDNIGIIGALLILCIFLSVFPKTSGSFLTQKNIFNVLRQISSNLFLACGMTMVIILSLIHISEPTRPYWWALWWVCLTALSYQRQPYPPLS